MAQHTILIKQVDNAGIVYRSSEIHPATDAQLDDHLTILAQVHNLDYTEFWVDGIPTSLALLAPIPYEVANV